jgi:pimeloyl-ACP methyl ester carboxylesterase
LIREENFMTEPKKQILWARVVGLLTALTILIATACSSIGDKSAAKLQAPDCGSLRGMTIPASAIGLPTSGAVVQSAELVAETAKGNINGEFCKVIAIIKPVNPKSPNIEFEVNLPTTWNGRALQLGGGGYDGTLVTGLTTEDGQLESMPTPLKRGFVTLGSDSGHKSAWAFDGLFGLDDEALLNYGKQSIKKVHDAAMHIIHKAYSRVPDRFYFIGSSQGGHEALDAAARYPEDYDGVVSHFPAYNITMLHLGSLNVGRAVYANGGAGWINPAKTRLIAETVYAACDKLDGAQDGIISNIKGCNTAFDVNKLRCPNGVDTGNTCLSDAQIAVARKIASDYRPGFAIAGADTFPKWALFEGSQFQVSTFGNAPKPGPSRQDEASALGNGLLFSVGEQTVKYIITRNPNQDPLSFDERQWKDRIATVASIMDVTNVSLEKFRARGGKIILTHGTIDDFITPHNSVAYYERQVKQFSKPVADGFIRFYMIPGYGHGFGPFSARFDGLQALQDWVEKGKAPEQLTAIDANPNANRSRPLCEWPAWPKFTGAAGTENIAASYTCVTN